MNHPSNENPKPLGEQTPSAEDDQPLQQFLDRAASEEPNAPAEDPFFSPLPDIDISGDEPEDGVSDDTPDEAPDDVSDNEAPDAACTETTYISEQALADAENADTAEMPAVTEEKPRRKCGRIIGIAAGAVGDSVPSERTCHRRS